MPNLSYVEQSCGYIVNEPLDKLRVVGKKALVHLTVDVWDTVGCATDNVVRVFNKGNCVYKDELYYWSKEDGNIDEPPSNKWTIGNTKCDILEPYRYVDSTGVPIENGDCLVTCEDLDAVIQKVDNLDFDVDLCSLIGELPDVGEQGSGHSHVGVDSSGNCVVFALPPDKPDGCLPNGTIAIAKNTSGTFDIPMSGTPDRTLTGVDSADIYNAVPASLALTVADYPCLAEPGITLKVRVDCHVGYYVKAEWALPNASTLPDYYPNSNSAYVESPGGHRLSLAPYQAGLSVSVDGNLVAFNGDRYGINLSGFSSTVSDTLDFEIVTTGSDIVIDTIFEIRAATSSSGSAPIKTAQDVVSIDMQAVSASFFS